ncbi:MULTISPECIES: hypothetical protein [unclassified Nocardioides]|uniref:hypothetical protein n=1 Tax=unclassified Nocardioides TaxID=2615069 RepID=UPI000056FB2F|nr:MULTISPECIES: hypothetical protein [unclassified Nocardioides]ABL81611.1 conserved hypothetical membrane protein [Nocardioides sp. JS614]
MTNAAPPRPSSTRAGTPRGLLLLPAGLAMLAGLDAALLLLGVPAPVTTDRLPDVHGMLMVLGFVGTLVCLERSVALGRPLGYLAPALLGAGGLLLLAPVPLAVGRTGLLLGMLAMSLLYVPLWRRQRDDAVLVQALGAVLGAGAAAMWLGGAQTALLVPWLAGFLVLTIAGERLELARLAMGPKAGPTLVLLCLTVMAATVGSLLWPDVGYPLVGLALAALTGWLVAHDVAWRTVRRAGLTRFMAASMLAGYFWLLVAAGTWLLHGSALSGAPYDVVIHATFLGFTISMIMAHAPVILPAVLRRPLPYRTVLWAPLVVLHASLVLRLWIGDALGAHLAWQIGGAANVVALLSFFALAAWSVLAAARRPSTVPAKERAA